MECEFIACLYRELGNYTYWTMAYLFLWAVGYKIVCKLIDGDTKKC